MRTTCALVVLGAGVLSVGGTGASALGGQTCCHSSAEKSRRSSFLAASTASMTSVGVQDVREQFNASSQKVRVVALLSPTCPDCQSGHETVGRVLKKYRSAKLAAILVWEPMRDGDSATSASQQAGTVQDDRISQGWDSNRSLGKLFGEILDIHEIAWDVYLVYKPGIRWEGTRPPRPKFWMHQLAGVDPKLLLCANPTRLSEEVGKLLGETD
jgi:hypothetical protein